MSTSKSSSKNTTQTTDARTTNTINAGLQGDIADALVAAGNYGDTSLAMSQITNTFEDHADNSMKLDMADYSDRSVTDNSDNSSRWTDYSDNSLKLNLSDTSNRSVNDNTSNNWLDTSDNSLNLNMSDTSNRSVNDYSDNSHTTINTTDGGAFDLVRDFGNQALMGMSGVQKETLGAVNNIVERGYDSFDKLSLSAFEKIDSSNERATELVESTSTAALDFVKESGAAMMDFVKGMVTTNMENMAGLASQSLAGAMNIKAGETISDPANQNLKAALKAGVALAGVGGLIYVMRNK